MTFDIDSYICSFLFHTAIFKMFSSFQFPKTNLRTTFLLLLLKLVQSLQIPAETLIPLLPNCKLHNKMLLPCILHLTRLYHANCTIASCYLANCTIVNRCLARYTIAISCLPKCTIAKRYPAYCTKQTVILQIAR